MASGDGLAQVFEDRVSPGGWRVEKIEEDWNQGGDLRRAWSEDASHPIC
jgi:hypothetical protein